MALKSAALSHWVGMNVLAGMLTRCTGDQHSYNSSERDTYSGVRAYCGDTNKSQRRASIPGTETNLKTLKVTYATEADVLVAAQVEMSRIVRGQAALQISLAISQPALAVQTPVKVSSFKAKMDGEEWLIKTVTASWAVMAALSPSWRWGETVRATHRRELLSPMTLKPVTTMRRILTQRVKVKKPPKWLLKLRSSHNLTLLRKPISLVEYCYFRKTPTSFMDKNYLIHQ